VIAMHEKGESDQSRAEALLRRLAGGPSTTRADQVIERLVEKGPPLETEAKRQERTLVEEVGRDRGPQAGGRKS
jgi:hypothetical protein